MDRLDITIYILGIAFLFASFYLLGKYNISKSYKKIEKLIADFHLSFYKILDKNCSVKRLNRTARIEIKDNSYLFNKCDIYIEDGFILILGFQDIFFKSITRTFIIAADIEKFKHKFDNWTVLKPKLVELNQTQLKIVYTAKTNNSDYSLIINGLNSEDYKNIQQIKNYC